jgi:N-acyl-D-amino-acid deacylase
MGVLLLAGGPGGAGPGAGGREAFVLVEGDSIRGVGPGLRPPTGAERIDASGLVVAPGFIDMHAHEFGLLTDPAGDSKLRQGVTTELVGMCGMSPAPVRGRGVEEVLSRFRGLGGYEGEVTWRSLAEFFDVVRGKGLITNCAWLVGHGTVRASVLGYENRPATSDELAQMKALVREGMEDGAWGLSSGLIYPPGMYAPTEELVELARVAAQFGGLYVSHIRGEGQTVFAAVNEVIRIAREAGIRAHISHLKVMGRELWGRSGELRALIDTANREGLDVTYDVYPYRAASTVMSALLPGWTYEGGPQALVERMGDPSARVRARADIEAGKTLFRALGWDLVLVVESGRPGRAGKTVSQIAAEEGKDPYDAAFDLLREEPQVQCVLFAMDDRDVRENLCGPFAMVGSDSLSGMRAEGPLSRSKPHPRTYGTFPKVLRWLVREERALGLEDAVHRMTGKPAAKVGLADRGRIAPGMKADLVIFDPTTVADRSTYTDPHRYPASIRYVLVNGEVAVGPEGTRPGLFGRVLLRGGRPGAKAAVAVG